MPPFCLSIAYQDSTVFNATRGLNGKLDFGPSVTAALVVADPIEACSTLSSASVSGKVVIARRGTCTFSLKAQMVALSFIIDPSIPDFSLRYMMPAALAF